MTFFEVVAHGATGTWLDEIVELGIPLVVLVILYFWSNRHPQKATRDKTADAAAPKPDEKTT